MKIIRIIGICLAAMFAFSAVAVSSASADLLFEPGSKKFPVLYKGLSSETSQLETVGGTKIECGVIHVKVVLYNAHLGLLHVLWLGCKNTILGGGACWTAGLQHGSGTSGLGQILLHTLFHLGLGHRGTELKVPAILALVPVGFEIFCNAGGVETKIPITGSAIGEIKPTELNKQLAKIPTFFKQTAGKQDMNLFLLSKLTNEEVMEKQVLSSTVLGKVEESGEKAAVELEGLNGETLEIKEG